MSSTSISTAAPGPTASPMAMSSCRPSEEYSRYNFELADAETLIERHFDDAEAECRALLAAGGDTARRDGAAGL